MATGPLFLRLAELVLRHQSTEPAPGGLVTAAFVVSMHRVFEDFVTAALREAFSAYPGHTSAQHDAFLDEQQTVAIRPDVVQFVRGRPVAVLDAKYKLADPAGGLPNADTYQLLAYCTALQVRAGWLVYAYGGAGGTRKVRHSSVEIDYLPLDLTAAPAELLAQVAELAREVYDRSAWLPALASGAS